MRRIPTSVLVFALFALSFIWVGQACSQLWLPVFDATCKVWDCSAKAVSGYDPANKKNVVCDLNGKSSVLTCIYNATTTCQSDASEPKSYQVCEGVLTSDGKTYCQIYYPECK